MRSVLGLQGASLHTEAADLTHKSSPGSMPECRVKQYLACVVACTMLLNYAKFPMSDRFNSSNTSFYIQGITTDGKVFRPSDWAERLCGVMAQFQPHFSPSSPLSYSPYVRPLILLDGTKCVMVDRRLHDIEPKALDFLLNFSKDNNLVIVEGGDWAQVKLQQEK